MKLLVVNQNKAERIVKLIITLFLIPAPFLIESHLYATFLGIIGGISLFNAISGTCFIYRIFGADTCKIR